MAETINKL